MTMLFSGNAEPPPWLSVLRLPALDVAIEMAIVRVEAELRDFLHVCSTSSGARPPDNKTGLLASAGPTSLGTCPRASAHVSMHSIYVESGVRQPAISHGFSVF